MQSDVVVEKAFSANLRNLYAQVSHNFDKLTDELSREGAAKSADANATDGLFTLNMLYLTQVYPAAASLLNAEDMPLLVKLEQAFGTAVWTAFRHLA